jgi:hypothetical protein
LSYVDGQGQGSILRVQIRVKFHSNLGGILTNCGQGRVNYLWTNTIIAYSVPTSVTKKNTERSTEGCFTLACSRNIRLA